MAEPKLYALIERVAHVVQLKPLKCVVGILAAGGLAGTDDGEAKHRETEACDHTWRRAERAARVWLFQSLQFCSNSKCIRVSAEVTHMRDRTRIGPHTGVQAFSTKCNYDLMGALRQSVPMPLTDVITVLLLGMEAAGTSVCDESVVETSVIAAHSAY